MRKTIAIILATTVVSWALPVHAARCFVCHGMCCGVVVK
jgi:hypothetical protein